MLYIEPNAANSAVVRNTIATEIRCGVLMGLTYRARTIFYNARKAFEQVSGRARYCNKCRTSRRASGGGRGRRSERSTCCYGTTRAN